MSFDLGKLFIEWRRVVPTGIPNPYNAYHLVLLKEICLKRGIDNNVVDNVILALEKKDIDPDTKIKYKIKDPQGNEKDQETTYDKALQRDKEHPAYIAAKKLQGDDGGEDTEDKSTSIAGSDISTDSYTDSALAGEPDADAKQTKAIKKSAERNKELWDKIEKEESPKIIESLKAEYISNQIDSMLKVSSIEKGAGRYDMNREDVQAYRKYLQKIMNNDKEPALSIDKIRKEQKRKFGEITEQDIDEFIEDIQRSSKSGDEKSDQYDPTVTKNIKTKIKTKGGPGASYYKKPLGEIRYRNVIKAYLETGGISPITGKHVPFSESQLDHIVSLGNQGKDEPNNWMFMEERFNQYKSKKTDEDIRANLERDYYQTDAEIAAGVESNEVTNALKVEDRAFWKDKFEKAKGTVNPKEIGLTLNQINKMTKPQLNNLVVGWNLAYPDNELSRYATQKIDYNGNNLEYARGEGKDNPIKPIENDPSTYGLSVGKGNKVTQDTSMDYEASLKAFNDKRASGGREKNKKQYIEMLSPSSPSNPDGIGLASNSTALDEKFNKKLTDHQDNQERRRQAIKDKIKQMKDLPGSGDKKQKIVDKSLSVWDKNNAEPGKGKPAKERQKSPKWKKWKKNRDTYEYKQWTQFDPYKVANLS